MARIEHQARRIGPANIIGEFAHMNTGAVTVRQTRCAVVRNRNVSCMKCADACTSGCISMVDGALTIDASKCVGCGTCATVCPTCALEAHNPNDAQLAAQCAQAVRSRTVAIACQPCLDALGSMADAGAAADVVCLGRVDESLIAGLAANGVASVKLVCGNCNSCRQKRGRECAEMVAESATGLLACWGLTVDVEVTGTVPPSMLAEGVLPQDAQAALDGYFTQERGNKPLDATIPTAAESTDSEDAGQVIKVMKDGTLPHFIPDRRERLLDALASIGAPVEDTLQSRLWGCTVINGQKCSSCRMCATFCPTGAIRKFDNEDGTFGVEHFPGDCVKCGSCRDICPEDAIFILDEVKASFVMDGDVHTYTMKPRPAELDGSHQILNAMKLKIDGDVFER